MVVFIYIYALGKGHMCSTSSLSSFPNVAFETVPLFVWLTMVLSRPFKDHLAFPRPLPLSSRDQLCVSLALCLNGSVSSFSAIQILREASHLWGLLCPPVYLLDCFHSLRHVQGSTPTGVFEGIYRPWIHCTLDFPFHFSLFVASSLNLWGWWHVWSDCHLLRQSSGRAWVTVSTFIVY